MRRTIVLVLIALGLIAILLFVYNPHLLEKVWLWVIGLIGLIASAFKNLIQTLTDSFRRTSEKKEGPHAAKNEIEEVVPRDNTLHKDVSPKEKLDQLSLIDHYETKISTLEGEVSNLRERLEAHSKEEPFDGITLTVLRYEDDGETTLGLLFVESEFFSYTLEDTFREVKIPGKTRIPKGTYKLDFNRNETGLTLKYRKTRPWFHYHLHVKNVPNFEGIYIHSGSTHEHTEGCLLVAKSIYADSVKSSIFDSRKTFETLYKTLKPKLDNGELVRIKYFDEDFLKSNPVYSNQA